MSIVFAEYKIVSEFRQAYLDWADAVQRQYPQLTIYEGTDQPGLFVEVWSSMDEAGYLSMKAVRSPQGSVRGETAALSPEDGLPDSSGQNIPAAPEERKAAWQPLIPMSAWIAGGAGKLHLWRFAPIEKR